MQCNARVTFQGVHGQAGQKEGSELEKEGSDLKSCNARVTFQGVHGPPNN
jgi:hypothetical protein